jgi:hypothetical protein
MHMTDEQKAKQIASLVREREMAEKRGDRDAVAAIGGELSRLGADAKPPTRRAQRRSPRRSEE